MSRDDGSTSLRALARHFSGIWDWKGRYGKLWNGACEDTRLVHSCDRATLVCARTKVIPEGTLSVEVYLKIQR